MMSHNFPGCKFEVTRSCDTHKTNPDIKPHDIVPLPSTPMAFHSDGPRSSADLLSGSRSWNANNIQKLGHNVEQVERISIADLTEESLSTLIQSRVVRDGLPLVISDFHKTDAWDPEIFTPEWLADNHVVKCECRKKFPPATTAISKD